MSSRTKYRTDPDDQPDHTIDRRDRIRAACCNICAAYPDTADSQAWTAYQHAVHRHYLDMPTSDQAETHERKRRQAWGGQTSDDTARGAREIGTWWKLRHDQDLDDEPEQAAERVATYLAELKAAVRHQRALPARDTPALPLTTETPQDIEANRARLRDGIAQALAQERTEDTA